MAEITVALIKQLRDKTSAGMMDCKAALKETDGDLEAAETALRKKNLMDAGKKAGRDAKEGVIASRVAADGKFGVMIEVNCETDFVAKNENFRDLVKDITLHIAAANPTCVSRDQIDPATIEREKGIYRQQVEGKPENIVEKIIEGKVEKFYGTSCLMEQPFIKNPDVSITDLVKAKITELGENLVIRRFTRYVVGEGITDGQPANG